MRTYGIHAQRPGHYLYNSMSQAFVKESDEQWLHEIPPTMAALLLYLRRENNGVRIYEMKSYPHPETGKTAHEMSNGLCYRLDAENKWSVLL